MKRLSLAVGLLVLFFLLLTAGCYTVLRHPTGKSVVDEARYYRSCADCHAEAAYYHPYYRYGGSHNRWRTYYGYPWWYDQSWWWYPYDHGGSGTGPEVEHGTPHLWGSAGWASGGWGFHRPSGEGSRPSRDDEPRSQPDQKPDQNQDEKKDDKKEKDDRHLWKTRKKGF